MSLSDYQFGGGKSKYSVTKSSHSEDPDNPASYPERDEYQLWKEDPQSGQYSNQIEAMKIVVEHQPGRAEYQYPAAGGERTTDPDRADHSGYNGNWATGNSDPATEQIKMFQSWEKPAKSTLDLLVGTKKDRGMAPTMLGIASLETAKTHHRELTPSTDLSPRSEKLVNNLGARGVVQGKKTMSNDLGFSGEYPSAGTHYLESQHEDPDNPRNLLNPHIVAKGKQHARSVIRGSRQPKPIQKKPLPGI